MPAPLHYAAWSPALAWPTCDGITPCGVGASPDEAIADARRQCLAWYSSHTVPAGRGAEEWTGALPGLRVWAVYPAAGADPLGAPQCVEIEIREA